MISTEASFEGGWGGPSPPKEKERKKKRKKKKKKKEKKKERKKGTMNNVKLLHIKCCFFQFFNSPVALKNLKKFWPPQEKVEMTPLMRRTIPAQVRNPVARQLAVGKREKRLLLSEAFAR